MIRDTLERYKVFMETQTPAVVDRLGEMYTDDIHFRDPFSDVHGLKGLRVVFDKMYADVPDSRFKVLDMAESREGGYLKWRYSGTFRGELLEFVGISDVAVRDGKVARHTDYYDAASTIYERLPVLRWLVRAIKKRVGHAD